MSLAEPDGMVAYQLAMESPDRSDPTWPLPSFDAADWAEAFVRIATELGHPGISQDWMVTWFANALMRGWDEHARRTAAESNQIGGAETEVGRFVYRRIEALMDAKPSAAVAEELSYLAEMVANVEEYGATGDEQVPV